MTRVYRSLTALADGAKIRTARFEERDHLVVPVVMLVGDAVLRPMRSEVPELVPAALLAEAPSQWDGRPVVATHPDDGRGSANRPRTLESMRFGTVFNTAFRRGALQGEAWIDAARAEAIGGDAEATVLELRKGRTVEVSVGAWVSLVEEDGVSPGGVPYGARWATLASDHLAVGLDGSEGACSVDMGCGAPRAAQGKGDAPTVAQRIGDPATSKAQLRVAVRSAARRPTFSGTESTAWSAPSFADYVRAFHDGDDPPSSVGDASAELKRRIASTTLLGDSAAEDFRDLAFFPVVSTAGNLNERALRAVIGGRGAQANIPAAARDSARRMARRLLNSEFDADLEVNMAATGEQKSLVGRAFDRFLHIVGGAEFKSDQGLSDSDVRSLLWQALRSSEPAFDGVAEIFQADGLVVYIVSPDGKTQFLQRSFAIDENGSITLGDDVEKVAPRTRFEPLGVDPADEAVDDDGEPKTVAEGSQAAASCGCHDEPSGDEPGKTEEVPAMADETKVTDAANNRPDVSAEKRELINLLIANTRAPFGAEDFDWLAVVPETKLRELREEFAPVPHGAPTDEEYIEALPENLRNAFRRMQAQETERRTEVIALLKHAQDEYTLEQLRAKPTTELESLMRVLGLDKSRPNYSGRGIPIRPEDYPAEPPDPYKAGLEKLRAKYNN